MIFASPWRRSRKSWASLKKHSETISGSVDSVRRRSAFVFTLLIVAIFAFDALFPADLSPRPHTRVVVDRHGAPLRHFADAGVWRYRTDPVHVSSRYLEALLTFEDRWFYEHPGVNPLALARATLQWMRSGHIVSGGSTLTMQVARIRYPGHRGWWGKLVQIVRALQLEAHHTKAEILTYYLNHAPFGGPLEGVEVASRAYFGYPAAQLTWSQAALLAGLPQAPSRFRPDRYAERARTQRDKVLERLHTAGVLSAAEVQSAKLEEVEAYAPDSPLLSPLLARRLIRHTPNAATVSTFIDSEIQRALESNVREHKSLLPAGASVALLAMEHGSGEVVAYVGSVDFTDATRFGHVDMVTARRSPGSTLKPFIYALAMDRGILHSGSLLMDVPLNFGDYRPVNFNRGFSGPVSVTTALQKSLNIPAVQVLEQLNPDHFYAAIQTAGADLHLLPGAKPNLAIALGGVSTSLEHLVTLYSALGNGGETLRPRLTPEEPLIKRPLLTPASAWIVRQILQTNPAIRYNRPPLAIKTGTSSGYKDSWAVAVGPSHTLGVWIGHPANAAMTGHTGSASAVPLLRAAARHLPTTSHRVHPQPFSVRMHSVCWPGGGATTDRCDQRKDAWIIDDQLPATLMATVAETPLFPQPFTTFYQADDSGKRVSLGCVEAMRRVTVALWPAPLQSYLPPEWRTLHRIPPLDPRCDPNRRGLESAPVRITGLTDGSRLKRHPSTPPATASDDRSRRRSTAVVLVL